MDRLISSYVRKLPLTKYDFFGYFIPGFIFVLSIAFYEYIFFHNGLLFSHRYFYSIFKMQIIFINNYNSIWLYPLIIFIIDVILIYLIGHIISSISSIFIDRILVYKAYGYPYEFLLKEEEKKDKNIQLSIFDYKDKFYENRFSPEEKSSHSPYFYKSIYFYSNVYFLLLFLSLFFKIHIKYINIFILILFIFLFLCKIIIETKYYKYKINKNINNKLKKILKFIFETLLPSPYSLFSSTLSKYLNTKRGFSAEFIKVYKKCFNKVFVGLDSKNQATNNFWLPYCYVLKESPEHTQLLSNWLHLYSFARNVSTSFYLIFLYILLNYLIGFYKFSGDISLHFIYILPILYFALSILMLIRFYYLYVNYFTKFLFRSFVTLTINK